MEKRIKMDMPEYDTIVIGSGAAGLNAADSLYDLGVHDIAVITEGRCMGTSRNTGSDKQTYYKISTSGSDRDSVEDMAKTLFSGGSMDGDMALIEAAYSGRCFYKLVCLGLPFPYNEYGEFVGYRTDHDERKRATSCGPLTSRLMTEALERSVQSKNIPILSGERVFKIITEKNTVCGVVTVNKEKISEDNPFGAAYYSAKNVIYAVGGPSAIYDKTVYPASQTCALGAAFEAGCEGINLTESQYGIASTSFRWNLSGTYQQVIPTYLSVDSEGKKHEFLRDVFDSDAEMFNAIFMKGYQWPFDPAKVNEGSKSSRVDLAVFREIQKGNRVYLDYRKNPSGFSFDLLSEEARSYLRHSDALTGTPLDRLRKMNQKAIDLYQHHGISLEQDLLEIAVCAQHNNGGLRVDTNYMSTKIKNLYCVGECAGIYGIRRPGGTALNSTQVGSLRAAQHIAGKERTDFSPLKDYEKAGDALELLSSLTGGALDRKDIFSIRKKYGEIMSECGAFLRSDKKIPEAIRYFEEEVSSFDEKYKVKNPKDLTDLLINRDIALTSLTYLGAIHAYIEDGGKSRGSYLISDELFPKEIEIDTKHFKKVQIVSIKDGRIRSKFVSVKPIPKGEQWFEKVYNR